MKELDTVILRSDLTEFGLKEGDIGTIVLVHSNPPGLEVEFTTLDGQTLAVVSLSPGQLRPIAPGEIAHARRVANAA